MSNRLIQRLKRVLLEANSPQSEGGWTGNGYKCPAGTCPTLAELVNKLASLLKPEHTIKVRESADEDSYQKGGQYCEIIFGNVAKEDYEELNKRVRSVRVKGAFTEEPCDEVDEGEYYIKAVFEIPELEAFMDKYGDEDFRLHMGEDPEFTPTKLEYSCEMYDDSRKSRKLMKELSNLKGKGYTLKVVED